MKVRKSTLIWLGVVVLILPFWALIVWDMWSLALETCL